MNDPLELNYLALYACIVSNCSVTTAVSKIFENRKTTTKKARKTFDVVTEDPAVLIKLKKKYTYKELAKMYNTYPDKIYLIIKKYKEKKQ